jgi:hypothetical protein
MGSQPTQQHWLTACLGKDKPNLNVTILGATFPSRQTKYLCIATQFLKLCIEVPLSTDIFNSSSAKNRILGFGAPFLSSGCNGNAAMVPSFELS